MLQVESLRLKVDLALYSFAIPYISITEKPTISRRLLYIITILINQRSISFLPFQKLVRLFYQVLRADKDGASLMHFGRL